MEASFIGTLKKVTSVIWLYIPLVLSVSMTCGTRPRQANLGTTNFTVYCNYILNTDENFNRIEWGINRPSYVQLFSIQTPGGRPIFFFNPTVEEYMNLIYIISTQSSCLIVLKQISCETNESYDVRLLYNTDFQRTYTVNINVTSQAYPTAALENTYAKVTFKEDSVVNFTCQINTGKPPGAIKWGVYIGDTGTLTDLTHQAVNVSSRPDPNYSCINIVTQQLSLTLLANYPQSVVKCSVHHPDGIQNFSQSAPLLLQGATDDPGMVSGTATSRTEFNEDSRTPTKAAKMPTEIIYIVTFGMVGLVVLIVAGVVYYIYWRRKNVISVPEQQVARRASKRRKSSYSKRRLSSRGQERRPSTKLARSSSGGK